MTLKAMDEHNAMRRGSYQRRIVQRQPTTTRCEEAYSIIGDGPPGERTVQPSSRTRTRAAVGLAILTVDVLIKDSKSRQA